MHCGNLFRHVTEFTLLTFIAYSNSIILSTESWAFSTTVAKLCIFIVFLMLHTAEQFRCTSRYRDKILFRRVPGQGILTAAILVFTVFIQHLQVYTKIGDDVSTDLLLIYVRIGLALTLSALMIGAFFILQIDMTFFSLVVLFACYFLQDCITEAPVFIPLIAVIIFLVLFWFLNTLCPRSFTIGESAIICQGVTYFLIDFLLFFMKRANISISTDITNLVATIRRSESHALVSALLFSTLAITLLLSPVFYCFAKYAKTEKDYIVYSFAFYVGIVLNVAAILIPVVSIVLGDPIFKFLSSFVNISSLALIAYWLTLLALSAAILIWNADCKNTRTARLIPNIIVRKSFHFIAVFIYVPGIRFYPDLMKVASCLAVMLMIVLEYVRVFKIYPFANLIHKYMISFVDERDNGCVIVTHIYLLLGFSVPIWMFSFSLDPSPLYYLIPYAGVISLGFGDAFASIIGTLYGKIRIPGTKKTITGTAACIASQFIASLLILALYHCHISLVELLNLFLCMLFVGFIEAITLQIDNLIMPLVLYWALIVAGNSK